MIGAMKNENTSSAVVTGTSSELKMFASPAFAYAFFLYASKTILCASVAIEDEATPSAASDAASKFALI